MLSEEEKIKILKYIADNIDENKICAIISDIHLLFGAISRFALSWEYLELIPMGGTSGTLRILLFSQGIDKESWTQDKKIKEREMGTPAEFINVKAELVVLYMRHNPAWIEISAGDWVNQELLEKIPLIKWEDYCHLDTPSHITELLENVRRRFSKWRKEIEEDRKDN